MMWLRTQRTISKSKCTIIKKSKSFALNTSLHLNLFRQAYRIHIVKDYNSLKSQHIFLPSVMEIHFLFSRFSQDRDALMKLLTFENVEELVKKRVEKKAMIFGQEVSLGNGHKGANYKVDPSVVSKLYGDWIMPFTKLVQVEYLLRRLD